MTEEASIDQPLVSKKGGKKQKKKTPRIDTIAEEPQEEVELQESYPLKKMEKTPEVLLVSFSDAKEAL